MAHLPGDGGIMNARRVIVADDETWARVKAFAETHGIRRYRGRFIVQPAIEALLAIAADHDSTAPCPNHGDISDSSARS